MSAAWEMIVGLEVHAQLKTRTKAFCRCSTSFGDPPNTNTCPVCLALPGALPVLNERAVELAARAALALGLEVRERSVFARKNYFYPDLPKGYQISQFDRPLAERGSLAIGGGRSIGITRIHMEEDAGKSVHDRFAGFTAIDLNRAGVPLIEIVGEPEIRSSAEAGAYLRALKQKLLFAEVSDCSMEEGSLRVDANVSARPVGESTFRTRTEIKNLNSFSNVERALELEYARHVAVHESGGKIVQQTMLYDANKNEVRAARSKEGSHDYRYFPEPDLPPLVLTKAWCQRVEDEMPESPETRVNRYSTELALSGPVLVELTTTRAPGDYFQKLNPTHSDAAVKANWVMGEVSGSLNQSGRTFENPPVDPRRVRELIELEISGYVSHTAAKAIHATMLREAASGVTQRDPKQIADTDGHVQVGDDSALAAWIDEVWAEHPAEAARFAGGERKLQGVLVGLVMKKSKGRANPKKVNQLLGARAGT
jgi:aspartyl-tRNA(Asn)/glutamyl-tRNA(Gln) amidotransferase subunit B